MTTNFTYDVFISYARKDGANIAQHLHDTLRDKGLRVFLDKHHIDLGEEWWRRIEDSIHGAKLFLFIITESSVASEVCAREWNTAKNIPRPILPILVEDSNGHTIDNADIPDYINRINYVNATLDWNQAIDDILFHITRYDYLYELADDLTQLVSENTARRFIEIIGKENASAKKPLKRRM